MAQFRVRYSKNSSSQVSTDPIRGTLTVTETGVQLETRVPLLSPLIGAGAYFFGLSLFSVILPLYLLFSNHIPSAGVTSPPELGRMMPDLLLVWGGIGVLIMPLTHLRLRRRCLSWKREEITSVEVQAREILLRTASTQVVVTTRTTADARQMAAAVREGTPKPVTQPIQYGRDSLFDNSGFYHEKPVTVSVQDGQITVHGAPFPSLWRILAGTGAVLAGGSLAMACLYFINEASPLWLILGGIVIVACIIGGFFGFYLIVSNGRKMSLTFPCTDLHGLLTVHRYITFLAQDTKLGERRYTLQTPSPADATALKQCIQDTESEAWQGTCHVAKNQDESLRYLRRMTPENATRAGHLLINSDTVTFIGRSGLAHPWAWRLAALITLAVIPVVVSLVKQTAVLPLLDAHDKLVVISVGTMITAIPFVYLPASLLLSRLLATRMLVPRKQIVHATRLGNFLTITVATKATIQYVTMATETDSDAEAMVEMLNPAQV